MRAFRDPGANAVGTHAALWFFVMVKTRKVLTTSGMWPAVLVAMAAANRTDGGVGLQHLAQKAGFADEPAMTIVVKRPRAKLVDPYVEDVLDALRSLCA